MIQANSSNSNSILSQPLPFQHLLVRSANDDSLKQHILNTRPTVEWECKPSIRSDIRIVPTKSLGNFFLRKRGAAIAKRSVAKLDFVYGKKTVVKTTNTKKKIKRKKGVRFCTKKDTTRTLPQERSSLTKEQQHQMWYQPQDYKAIDQECHQTVRALASVHGDLASLPCDEFCIRGLEMKASPQINRLRRLRLSISSKAVLGMQEYCRKASTSSNRVVSVESLAAVSWQYTQRAKIRAKELGLIDSIEASRNR